MITIIYISACFIQLLYWAVFHFAFRNYKHSDKKGSLPPVSVVVCFKNEQRNILQLLDFLCTQDYPDYEIILVNDFSNDATEDLISDYDDPRVVVVHAQKDIPGKKEALDTGIRASRYHTLVLTDADCRGSLAWLEHMVTALPDKGITLGYAPLMPGKTLTSIFASYESWLTGVQYLSYAILSLPYMGVGRNMAYHKDIYLENDGYEKHKDTISGDDDLLVNAMANQGNTSVQLHPESFVFSEPPHTLQQLLKQKSRQMKSSLGYKRKYQLLLGIFSGSHILLYMGLILTLTAGTADANTIVYAFIFTIVVKYILSLVMIDKLRSPFIKLYFPLMDFMLFTYYLIMMPLLFFKKDNTWK